VDTQRQSTGMHQKASKKAVVSFPKSRCIGKGSVGDFCCLVSVFSVPLVL